MVIEEVKEVLLKYKVHEDKIENILKEKQINKSGIKTLHVEGLSAQTRLLTLEEAKERNSQLIKELEFVKGNLRSKSIFSPMELQWGKVREQYQNNPSLPIITWHCHLPVFI
ncbi:hypothetical protein ABEB36_008241 [Hypothenemus hampei]|uniref:Uncharacterized protein n=1 Tax=Hypothenemus hampei TaxID=57062 RepID=A0ABD1EL80_HYPHA